jgi:hypothetical protein
MKIIKERARFRNANGYIEPGQGKCVCGLLVKLTGFTNSCECDRDYNLDGGLLAPRSQWGADTGESLQEIMGIE